MQVIYRKRATNYRAVLREMTCEDKAFNRDDVQEWTHTHERKRDRERDTHTLKLRTKVRFSQSSPLRMSHIIHVDESRHVNESVMSQI